MGRGLGLRDGIQGETARFERLLRDGLETYSRGNFLKYINVILRKSPNNEGNGFTTSFPFLANKDSSARTKLHTIKLLTKVVLKKSLHSSSCLQVYRFLDVSTN